MRRILIIALACVSLVSCVSTKKFKAEQQRVADLTAANSKLACDLKTCEDNKDDLTKRKALLETEIDGLNK